MSGIVAILNLDQTPSERNLLEAMTASMTFRGPEGSGTWIADSADEDQPGCIGLGKTLLRTTFESEKEQTGPCTLGEGIWISADARLDDRERLLSELRSAGRAVEADTPDPQLILHSYAAWGEDCLAHLLGDFAFILWDEREQFLLSARDQIGVATIYYAQVEERLLLGNTLNTLRLHPGISSKLNEQAVGEYLLFLRNLEFGITYFEDIQRLPPAHKLTWRAGQTDIQITRYYSLPELERPLLYKDPQDYVEHFREVFSQAVGDRLRNHQIAVSMSGGMDSTSVAGMAQRLIRDQNLPVQLEAHTFVYEKLLTGDEEGLYAGYAAEYLGIPHHIINLDHNLFAPQRPHRGYFPPSPTTTPRDSNAPKVLQRAAGRGRVILSGLGGDPIMKTRPFYWLEALRFGDFRGLYAQVVNSRHLTGKFPSPCLGSLWRRMSGQVRNPQPFPDWIDPEFAERLNLKERLESQQHSAEDHSGLENMLWSPFWSEVFTNREPEANGMPVRMRYPIFDLRLIEYVRKVPTMPWRRNKFLLRQAMQGYLPRSVLERRKAVLVGNPRKAMTQQGLYPEWYWELATAPELAGYVDLNRMGELVQAAKAGEYSREISQVTSLAYWLQGLEN